MGLEPALVDMGTVRRELGALLRGVSGGRSLGVYQEGDHVLFVVCLGWIQMSIVQEDGSIQTPV